MFEYLYFERYYNTETRINNSLYNDESGEY